LSIWVLGRTLRETTSDKKKDLGGVGSGVVTLELKQNLGGIEGLSNGGRVKGMRPGKKGEGKNVWGTLCAEGGTSEKTGGRVVGETRN